MGRLIAAAAIAAGLALAALIVYAIFPDIFDERNP